MVRWILLVGTNMCGGWLIFCFLFLLLLFLFYDVYKSSNTRLSCLFIKRTNVLNRANAVWQIRELKPLFWENNPLGLVTRGAERVDLEGGGERPRVTSERVHRTLRRECVAATGREATHLGARRGNNVGLCTAAAASNLGSSARLPH